MAAPPDGPREGLISRGSIAPTDRRPDFFTSVFATGALNPGEALNALTSVPSVSFQTRTSPLNAPAATRLPSGLTATA